MEHLFDEEDPIETQTYNQEGRTKSKSMFAKIFSKRQSWETNLSISHFDDSNDSFARQVKLACSDDDRRRLYVLSKQGFSYQERRDCWLLASGALQSMCSASPDYYRNLVEHSNYLLKIGFPSPHLEQIEVDLPRTFQSESFHSTLTKEGQRTQEQIWRIAVAYSVRNPHIGYC